MDAITTSQGIFMSMMFIAPHDRCSICSVMASVDALRCPELSGAHRSEIILSKLDLDNTSERTCVALIPDLSRGCFPFE